MNYMTQHDAIHKETGETLKVQVEEKCCIEHEGKKFCSGGAFISPEYVIGYTKETPNGLHITTWHGETITTKAHYTSKHPWGHVFVRAKINDKWFHGSRLKDGDLVKLKADKD